MHAPTNPTIKSSVSDMKKLEPMDKLDITPHENEHVHNRIKKHDTCTDTIINLQLHNRKKLHAKFREALNVGVPMENACLYTHNFKNNEPCIRLFFCLLEDNSNYLLNA